MRITTFTRLICLIGVLVTVPATTPAHARVRPGVEVGVNLSSLRYDDDNGFPQIYWDTGWKSSFTGGLSLDVAFRDRVSLLTGLRYVQQGNAIDFDFTPSGIQLIGELRFVQNYISIPAVLTVRPLPTPRLFFSLGPEVSFLVSGRVIQEDSVPDQSTAYNDIEKGLESVILSLDAGAGFDFPIENHVAILSLRYTHGVTGAAKKDQWASGWKTQGIESLVGMKW